MYSVILCGGSGTRLWPLSRKNYPKQFLNLFGDKSLLQETYLRVRQIIPTKKIFFVTNKENYFNVLNQIKEVDEKIKPEQILIEPASLNTAPAITLAVKYLTEKAKANPSAPIIFLPSDHYITDKVAYLDLVKKAMREVGNNIGTIGVTPTKAETGYGYIKKGKKRNSFFVVSQFKEKPNKKTAERYLKSGEYVWNSGMYIASSKTFLQELRKHAPKIYSLTRKKYDEFREKFSSLPAVSIDVAISERSKKMIVFEGNFGWSDIGSFDSLAEILPESKNNPKHVSIDCQNVFVHSATDRLIATLGVENVMIVENMDSILVQKRGRSEEVRKIVDYLKKHDIKELEHNLIVHRPWGKYEIIIDSPSYKVKRITVYPGAKLSLQAHNHRAEHWIVVKGLAKIVHGENDIFLRENESTFIPALTRHRLENTGKINLELIEVQTGNYLGEDDIIRFDDLYNRIELK